MYRPIIVLLCFIASLAGSRAVNAQTAAGTFVPGPCAFKPARGYVAGKNLTCGMLVVPENWAAPAGRKIQLAVAIFRTPNPGRQPDPIVFLQGGPGDTVVHNLGSAIDLADAPVFMGNHDLILIDQRGTGASKPALTCPEVDAALVKALQRNASPAQQTAAQTSALQHCRDRLTAKGIDLNMYNTVNDAHDIAALRTALNLSAMDLYGVSYGGRVAMALIQYFPDGIRSVVLDSTLTPQYNLLSDPIAAEARAFNQLFTGCAQAPKCNRKYPHLRRTFTQVITRLNAHPLLIKTQVKNSKKSYTIRLNGDAFAEFVRRAMYETSLIPYLPEIINEGGKGFGQAYNLVAVAASADDLGTYESVTCSEDARTASTAAIDAAVTQLPKPLRASAARMHKGELTLCKVWNVAPAAQVPQAVTMNMPTLLLEGQYDPITSPANERTMESLLPHAFGFIFPNSGYGVYMTSFCAQAIITTFYDNPTVRPDSACLARVKSPFS
jgi:pimeloyl-ACP methyl ester carboxylesterase